MLTFESEALGESFQVKEPTRAELREVQIKLRCYWRSNTFEAGDAVFTAAERISGIDKEYLTTLCECDRVNLSDELALFYFGKGSEGTKKKPASPSESGSGSTA